MRGVRDRKGFSISIWKKEAHLGSKTWRKGSTRSKTEYVYHRIDRLKNSENFKFIFN